MSRRRVLLGLALLGLGICPGDAAPRVGENPGVRLVQKMLRTYRALDSFQQTSTSTLEMDMAGDRSSSVAFSRLVYRKPNRFRYQVSESQEARTVACDGRHLWVFSASLGHYTVQPAPASMERVRKATGVWGQSFMDAFAFLQGADPLRDARTVRLVGSARPRGVPVSIVELQGGPEGMGLSNSTTKLYIGQRDSLLHGSETRQRQKSFAGMPPPGAQGEPVVEMGRLIRQTHSSMKVNQPLTEGTFTFRPPRGARQVATLGKE